MTRSNKFSYSDIKASVMISMISLRFTFASRGNALLKANRLTTPESVEQFASLTSSIRAPYKLTAAFKHPHCKGLLPSFTLLADANSAVGNVSRAAFETFTLQKKTGSHSGQLFLLHLCLQAKEYINLFLFINLIDKHIIAYIRRPNA